ncbi:MAG: hydantoinase B/oxoprolinase family protein, partial [Alphaproteobacteria bacterium]|nr:hydantoinase B/oxoprolinase family protein [Alphaproteobacteria bacterium]
NGGLAQCDGPSNFVNVDFGNLPSIQNAEAIENEMPLVVDGYRLRVDAGGEGRQRGGVGMEREIRLLGDEARYSVLSDRAVIPPFGILGAGSGAPYHLALRRGKRVMTFDTPGKVTGHPIRRDDVVIMASSGGGGYGDPLERDPESVRRDVEAGYVSAARARAGYGVVLTAQGAVNGAATAALRRRLAARRQYVPLRRNDRIDCYVGVKGRRRIVALSPKIARRLGLRADDLIEMVGRHPAPLRAWVRISKRAPAATLAMDEFGCRVLGCQSGDHVMIRKLAMPDLPRGFAG